MAEKYVQDLISAGWDELASPDYPKGVKYISSG
jgi:hypothetical protein